MTPRDTSPSATAPAGSRTAVAVRSRAGRRRVAALRGTGRVVRLAALLACWSIIVLLAAITWGPRVTDLRTDIIIGSSMEPTIPLWSVIVVEPLPVEQIRRGDVITFEQPGATGRKVTHRVTRVERAGAGAPPQFQTKGDNNDSVDPWRVSYVDDAWRVRTHIPYVGRALAMAQTRGARVALIAVPVLVLLALTLRWIWQRPEPAPDAEPQPQR